MAESIGQMTREVREIARERASEIETPRDLLEKVAFNLGYFVGPNTTITSMCGSEGPVNPFNGKALCHQE